MHVCTALLPCILLSLAGGRALATVSLLLLLASLLLLLRPVPPLLLLPLLLLLQWSLLLLQWSLLLLQWSLLLLLELGVPGVALNRTNLVHVVMRLLLP